MPHAYTEDQLVEQPAIQLFAELGWSTASAADEVLGVGGTLGREITRDVVLERRLRTALAKLNPQLASVALEDALLEVTRDRSAMTAAAANREVWQLLRGGVKVMVPDHDGGHIDERVRIVDWATPAANDFLLVSQMTVTGPLYTCRPDLIGFVNGLPFVVIEFKRPGVSARQAFDDNLTSYMHPLNGVPQLFWYNALLVASNGTDSRVGSITADWDRFFEWKRIEREDEERRVSLEVILRGTCDKTRLLDLVENFTLFSELKAGLTKIIAQNHQFLGVNNAIAAMLAARKEGHGRGGVFWQTQGSGKSFAMVFFAQKVLRKVPGDWSFVVVTDRVELDEQIARTFAACGAVSDANASHASSGENLKELLSGNNRYVFTLIHKFQSTDVLCDRPDVVVLTDEAHRSQYDTLAVNMRSALPHALFVAFTGTPLIAGEERTKELFGDYVSVYDFQQSVEDGATVPLFYENRTPELELVNPDLNDDIYRLIEDAELGEDAEAKLQRELGRQYHILTRDDRLETVAKDIVAHFLGRGFVGKAMVVSMDKATALKMHDKVRKHWRAEKERIEEALGRDGLSVEEKAVFSQRLTVLDTTDMALIVSPGQNEIEQMKSLGLDILPHRRRINDEKMDEKFKDPADPLRIVFVCAMWLTGFDAPSCSTVYLDKPMRNHTLMQTIARANRVYRDKHSGLIVDYANVFVSLEKALAIYATTGGGATPVRDKQQLVAELRIAAGAAAAFCIQRGVSLPVLEGLPSGDMKRLELLNDAVNLLIAPDAVRKEFLGHARLVGALYAAVKPDHAVAELMPRAMSLAAIAYAIRATLDPDPADISVLMGGVGRVLDASITGVAIPTKASKLVDLSKMDFEVLRRRLKDSKHKNSDLEQLKAAIRAQLERMIQTNKSRADYLEKFDELIESYNNGSRSIEHILEELVLFAASLSAEEERHLRERLTEAELTVFDILTRPGPHLTAEEREEVKKVARQLLDRLRVLLALDWRQETRARAQVRLAIEDALDTGLPGAYSTDLYQRKCSAVFEHIYERYGSGGGPFA